MILTKPDGSRVRVKWCNQFKEPRIHNYFEILKNEYDPKSFVDKADQFLNCIPEYKPYSKICPYCRTDPVKMTCVNCGAPQTIPEAPRLKEGVYYGNYQKPRCRPTCYLYPNFCDIRCSYSTYKPYRD